MGSLATTGAYPGVAPFDEDEAKHRRQLAVVVNNLLRGKMNNTSTFTLAANAATTTLTDSRIGANSTILLHPTTANAAAAMATTYFSAFLKGSCTVNHANNAQVDKTFRYAVIG
jgi:hypothetical protein